MFSQARETFRNLALPPYLFSKLCAPGGRHGNHYTLEKTLDCPTLDHTGPYTKHVCQYICEVQLEWSLTRASLNLCLHCQVSVLQISDIQCFTSYSVWFVYLYSAILWWVFHLPSKSMLYYKIQSHNYRSYTNTANDEMSVNVNLYWYKYKSTTIGHTQIQGMMKCQ